MNVNLDLSETWHTNTPKQGPFQLTPLIGRYFLCKYVARGTTYLQLFDYCQQYVMCYLVLHYICSKKIKYYRIFVPQILQYLFLTEINII